MRMSLRTAKELREQLKSNRNMLAQENVGFTFAAKLVAGAETAAGTHGSRPSTSLRQTAGRGELADGKRSGAPS
jgi:hypothetical protein